MSGKKRAWRPFTAGEIEHIRSLYASGHSWPDIGKMIGRNYQLLSRKFGPEFRRPTSEAMKFAWANHGGPGPRHLNRDEYRRYKKLRRATIGRAEAVREIIEMRMSGGL
jgi:hypothetical protein